MGIKPVRKYSEPIYVFSEPFDTGIKLWHEDLEYLKRAVRYMYEISQDPYRPASIFKIRFPRKGCCGDVYKNKDQILGYIEKIERAQ